MAQLVISAAGAAIGYMVGGPFGAKVGWALGSALGSSFGPTQKSYGPQLQDLKVTGTEYGQAIPYVQGHPRVAGQIWWASDRRQIATTTSQGSKGGGGGAESTTYTYEVDLLIGLSDNEILDVARIWSNGKLVFTKLASASAESLAASNSTDLWSRMTVYTGAEDQMPDPDYEAAVGTANAPAYRGRGSVFIKSLQLGGAPAQLPNLTFELVTAASAVGATAFNANHKTNVVVLSDEGRTISIPAAAAKSDFAITQNKHITNQEVIYFEALVNSISGGSTDVMMGWVNPHADFLRIRWNYADISPSGTTNLIFWLPNGTITKGTTPSLVVTSTGILGYTAGDRLMFALNATTGKGWLGKNGTWFNSGDPAAGTNEQFSGLVAPAGTSLAFCVYRRSEGSATINASFNFGQTAFEYEQPVGFSTFANPRFIDTDEGRYWMIKNFSYPIGSGPYGFSEVDMVNGADVDNVVQTFCPFVRHDSNGGGSLTDNNFGSEIYWLYAVATDPDFFIKIDCGLNGGAEMTHLRLAAVVEDRWFESLEIYRSDDDINYALVDLTTEAFPGNNTYVDIALPESEAPPSAGEVIELLDEDLETVVRRLCLRAGLLSAEIDTSLLANITRPVRGLAISQVTSTRSVLEILQTAYFFEMTVSDKVYFVPRGAAAVATLTYDDLGSSKGGEYVERFELRSQDEMELPAQISLSYSNVNADYNVDVQESDRIISSVDRSVEQIQLPLVLTESEAKAIVDSMMLDQRASMYSTSIRLIGDFSALEPTDPVIITDHDGSTFRFRLVEKLDSYPLLEFEAVADDPAALIEQGITSTDYTPSDSVATPPATLMELLDIPILRDYDNDPGHYVAAKGATSPWPGMLLMKSNDDIDFDPVETVTETGVFGTCLSILGDWSSAHLFDEGSSVTVSLGASATLSSATRSAVLASQSVNAMLIGSEIIQFRNATLVEAGTYKLTGLLRGLRGTEWAMTAHAADERCVLLQLSGMRRISMQTTELGVSKFYRGVSIGRRLSTATSEEFTNSGIGVMPFSPVDLRGRRNSSNDVTLTWQRRTRLATRVAGPLGLSVPLGEASEQYEVDIFSDDTFTTLVRTLGPVSVPEVVYTAAEQTADGFTPGDRVHARIYQLSEIIDRGYPLERVV